MGPEVTRIHVCGLRAWSSRDRERSAVEAARRARACMACSACRYRNCMRSFPRQGECALCRPREIRDPLPFYYLSFVNGARALHSTTESSTLDKMARGPVRDLPGAHDPRKRPRAPVRHARHLGSTRRLNGHGRWGLSATPVARPPRRKSHLHLPLDS